MADYALIFFSCTLLNAAVTLRSSCAYPRLRGAVCNSSQRPVSSPLPDDASSPLLEGESDGDATENESSANKAHRNLLCRYLPVYLLATLSDWLQGPYVYALYDAYGFSRHSIAILFVSAFASSMVFGSFVGGLADGCGRRKFVLLYCATYATSCFTKHFNVFSILLLGRVLSGISTSLLFTVFDAWFIRAHAVAGVDKSALASSFSSASYGNSIIAIVAGLIANRCASREELLPVYAQAVAGGVSDATGGELPPAAAGEGIRGPSAHTPSSNDLPNAILYNGGYLNPFDLAFVALCLCGIAVVCLWEENYGDQKRGTGDTGTYDGDRTRRSEHVLNAWRRATSTVFGNKEILLCGVISSLFEGSLYVFIFMWTPALTGLIASTSDTDGQGHREASAHLPFGLVFSTFMVCCMAGSSTFSVAVEKGYTLEALGLRVLAVSSLAMLTIAFSRSDTVAFLGMNLFEMCVGMYFPAMGTLKSMIVPETSRAAIYNLYRIPVNLIVLVTLLSHFSVRQSFALCSLMLTVATIVQYRLLKLRSRQVGHSPSNRNLEQAPLAPG